jgi:hypothetical protein
MLVTVDCSSFYTAISVVSCVQPSPGLPTIQSVYTRIIWAPKSDLQVIEVNSVSPRASKVCALLMVNGVNL